MSLNCTNIHQFIKRNWSDKANNKTIDNYRNSEKKHTLQRRPKQFTPYKKHMDFHFEFRSIGPQNPQDRHDLPPRGPSPGRGRAEACVLVKASADHSGARSWTREIPRWIDDWKIRWRVTLVSDRRRWPVDDCRRNVLTVSLVRCWWPGLRTVEWSCAFFNGK